MAIASTNDEDEIVTDPPGEAYALSGEIMLASIVVLFVLVVFMVALHLYARWYLFRLRHRHHQINRRRHRHRHRHRRLGRSRIVLYADSVLPRPAIDRGLDPAVLHSLPVFIHVPEAEQPPPECAVCLSEFEEKEIVRLLPKCNHCFHEECIDMWFLSHSTCPLCRSSVEMVIGRRAEPAVKPLQEGLSFSEPGSSSASTFCDACQHESGDVDAASFGGLRKDSVLELTQSCPPSRLLSFKRILSMGMKPPAAASPSGGGGPTTPRGVNELDLESGTSESNREPGGVDRPS